MRIVTQTELRVYHMVEDIEVKNNRKAKKEIKVDSSA